MFIKGFFSNSFGILVSRIFGLIRDIMTAHALGASIYSDIFFVAFKLPNLFRRLFAEGAFTQAFLPNFVASKKKGQFCVQVLINFASFLALLSLTVVLFAPLFTKFLAFGFDENTITLATPLVRINFFYLFFIFLVTFFASILQYRGHFATTAFSTSLLNISMIIALFLSRGKSESVAVYYLSYGVVVGGILQALVHIIALKKINMLQILTLAFLKYKDGKRVNTDGFYKNFYHGIIGNSAAQLGSFMNTWFASFLMSGSISYLYYADRIFQLPLALFAIALSTALFPKIARLLKSNDEENALNLLSHNFHLLFALLLFASLGGILLSKEITWLIFQRGEFTQKDTMESAQVLAMYMLGLLPYGLSKLFSLWLYAKMQQKIAAKITIWTIIINVLFCAILVKPLQASGLALASSISGGFLLFYTIKIFGFGKFLALLKPKKLALIFALACLEILILYIFKGFIYAYIFN